MSRVVVVGAGPAGLTIGLTLAEAGIQTTVVERGSVVGGNCRSFTYGPFTFDVGVHCFGRSEPRVHDFILRHCGDDAVPVGGASAASYFRGAFRPELGALRARYLPPATLLRGAWDFLWRQAPRDPRSLGQVAASYYGRTFYEKLVKDRIEQLSGVRCDEVHVDFGRYFWLSPPTADLSVAAALRTAAARLLRRPPAPDTVDPFGAFYPTSGGFGEFCERLAARFARAGGQLLTKSVIDAVDTANGTVRSVTVGNRVHDIDWLIWTGDVGSLVRLLGIPPITSVDHLQLLLFHFEMAGDRTTDYLWVDFADPDMPVYRASYNNFHRPRNAPAGFHGITAEVACRATDDAWASPDRSIPAVRDQLVRTGFAAAPDRFLTCHIEKVPRAWPVFGLDYREQAEQALAAAGRIASNVSVTQRSGESLPTADRILQRALSLSDEVCARLRAVGALTGS